MDESPDLCPNRIWWHIFSLSKKRNLTFSEKYIECGQKCCFCVETAKKIVLTSFQDINADQAFVFNNIINSTKFLFFQSKSKIFFYLFNTIIFIIQVILKKFLKTKTILYNCWDFGSAPKLTRWMMLTLWSEPCEVSPSSTPPASARYEYVHCLDTIINRQENVGREQ